jgi:hypothetical protein
VNKRGKTPAPGSVKAKQVPVKAGSAADTGAMVAKSSALVAERDGGRFPVYMVVAALALICVIALYSFLR